MWRASPFRPGLFQICRVIFVQSPTGIMDAEYPHIGDELTEHAFNSFDNLKFVHAPLPRNLQYWDRQIDKEVMDLDEEKMMAHILDCVASLAEKQRVRVAVGKPLLLSKDKDAPALTAAQQAVRNKVFRVALGLLAEGLTHDGAAKVGRSEAVRQLALAFPDDGKLTDGRGWLPLHWAVAAAVGGERHGVTAADVEVMYSVDPLALCRLHCLSARRLYSHTNETGATPAHLLCMEATTEQTQGLVRFFSMAGPQSFTMDVSYHSFDDGESYHTGEDFGALHVACAFGQPTEWLVQQLLQLDDTACRKGSSFDCTPLGLMCKYSAGHVDERTMRCLLAADSSATVVYDGIRGCLESKLLTNRVETVTLLLEVNPLATAHYAVSDGEALAHVACRSSSHMSAKECIGILKLLLTANKGAFKQVDGGSDGWLPIHWLAAHGPVKALRYLLDATPEVSATTLTTRSKENLLHLVLWDEKGEVDVTKARLLCARYPAMMLQRDSKGRTPLYNMVSCTAIDVVMALCEAGGREVASAPVLHPTEADYYCGGWLPLHEMLSSFGELRGEESTASLDADAFRLLLRLYPEAAGVEAGRDHNKKTPYQLAVDEELPAYYRRLLLRAAPHLDPVELHRLTWEARQQAMFLGFRALGVTPPLLARLRYENKDLVKHVVSFL